MSSLVKGGVLGVELVLHLLASLSKHLFLHLRVVLSLSGLFVSLSLLSQFAFCLFALATLHSSLQALVGLHRNFVFLLRTPEHLSIRIRFTEQFKSRQFCKLQTTAPKLLALPTPTNPS